MKEYIIARIKERSTHGGAALVVAGLAFLFVKPIASLIAYAAIAYGVYQIATKD